VSKAQLRTDDLEGGAVRRFVVSCSRYVTTILYQPGRIELADDLIISVALTRHEEGCGHCHTEPLWRTRGCVELRDLTAEVWQRMLAATHVQERRN
jgi:hypothetical protein